MRCVFLPIWDGKGDKPVAYIGPSQNLEPETRRHLSPIDKQQLVQRRHSRCNCCGERIRLYPSANCDADHMTLENMQLLCVQEYRAKSAREAQGCLRVIDVGLEPGDTSVYRFASGTIQFPLDKRTPLEAIQNGCGWSILTFKIVDRTFVEDAYVEVDLWKMSEKFVYKPRIAC